ncbi:MAG: hypothetical protein AB7G44_15150 [Bacteroidia bacterium]
MPNLEKYLATKTQKHQFPLIHLVGFGAFGAFVAKTTGEFFLTG